MHIQCEECYIYVSVISRWYVACRQQVERLFTCKTREEIGGLINSGLSVNHRKGVSDCMDCTLGDFHFLHLGCVI